MFDVDCDVCVSEEQVTLWKELSCLHYANREIGKFCKRTRKNAPWVIQLEDGSRIMQQGLHKRLRDLCVQMFKDMQALGNSRQGYAYALCDTELPQRIRRLLRMPRFDPLPFLVQTMDKVIEHLEIASDTLASSEALGELRLLRGGFAQLAKSR